MRRSEETCRKMQEAVDMVRRPEYEAVIETTSKALAPTREEGITSMLTNGGLKAWLEAAAFAIPAFITTSLLAAVLQGG